MKIIRFEYNGNQGYGILANDEIQVLQQSPFTSLAPAAAGTKPIPLGDVRLLAPVQAPPNILAIGRNYRQHALETGSDIPDHPLLFLKATSALTDPDAPVVLPAEAPDKVDYEAELAIVISQKTKDVSPHNAAACILGYTCANDVSARDCQLELDGQWARGKSFDTFCPLGPWIETDLDPNQCRIEMRLNDEIRQQSNTADLMFDCYTLISYLSRQMTLLPGTVVLTGTPSGVGMASTPPRFLKHGDACEVSIAGIGTLRNPVVGHAALNNRDL